jgi:hypothetical protein
LSRLWLLLFWAIPLASAAHEQPAPDPAIAEIVEKGRQLTTIEKRKPCPEPSEDGEIVVCADPNADQDQRIFVERPPNEDRIRRGEAISTVKAAQCIGSYPTCAHNLGPGVGVGFGKVPPPAIPFEEVMKGLPEPDMVVPEGSTQEPVP